MTHDTPAPAAQNPAEDLAWLRQLAEGGARAPMRGASLLMFGGLLYGLASLFHWGLLVGSVPLPVDSLWIGWVGATVAYWVVLAIVIPRLNRTKGVHTTANKASGIAWSGMGWGIFALFLSMAVLAWRLGGPSPEMWALIPSVILVFYAVGWTVSATMFRSRAMGMLAAASFVSAPALAALAGTSWLYLAYAACLFGLMALPGYLFMRAANRA